MPRLAKLPVLATTIRLRAKESDPRSELSLWQATGSSVGCQDELTNSGNRNKLLWRWRLRVVQAVGRTGSGDAGTVVAVPIAVFGRLVPLSGSSTIRAFEAAGRAGRLTASSSQLNLVLRTCCSRNDRTRRPPMPVRLLARPQAAKREFQTEN